MGNGYADDPIKDKGRFEAYKMSDRHLPRDRSQIGALYMASDNDRESFWLDKLGILRSNRLILEENRSLVPAVEASNPDVRVLPVSSHEFLAQQAKEPQPLKWGYIGLDFECMLNDDVTEDISNIARGKLLIEGGIVYTNLVGLREKSEKQAEYMRIFLSNIDTVEQANEIFGIDFEYDKRSNEIRRQMSREGFVERIMRERGVTEIDRGTLLLLTVEQMRRMIEFLPEEKLEKLRSYAINRSLQNYLALTHLFQLNFIDTRVPGFYDLLDRYFNHPHEPSRFDEYYAEGALMRMSMQELAEAIGKFSQEVSDKISPWIKPAEKLCIRYYKRGGLELIPTIFKELTSFGYVAVDSKSFYYTSIKNTQMILDIMSVRSIHPTIQDTLNWLTDTGFSIYYRPDKPYLAKSRDLSEVGLEKGLKLAMEECPGLRRTLRKRVGYLENLDAITTRPLTRYSLGSSFRPPLTKALARKCILDGMTNQELDANYAVGNWNMVSAIRANVTKGYIKQPEPKRAKKPKPKPKPLPGSKYMVSRKSYALLPPEVQMRINYFREDVVDGLHVRRQRSVRQAFADSNLDKLLTSDIDPMRVYAFFDDVGMAITNGNRITPRYLNDQFISVRDAASLTTVSPWEPKPAKLEPSEAIKAEVRQLAAEGFKVKDLWPEYGHYFKSPKQMGAVIAWAHPNLKKKRKK